MPPKKRHAQEIYNGGRRGPKKQKKNAPHPEPLELDLEEQDATSPNKQHRFFVQCKPASPQPSNKGDAKREAPVSESKSLPAFDDSYQPPSAAVSPKKRKIRLIPKYEPLLNSNENIIALKETLDHHSVGFYFEWEEPLLEQSSQSLQASQIPFKPLNISDRPAMLIDKIWDAFEDELYYSYAEMLLPQLDVIAYKIFNYDLFRSIPKAKAGHRFALDIGCGLGLPLLYLQHLGWISCGIRASYFFKSEYLRKQGCEERSRPAISAKFPAEIAQPLIEKNQKLIACANAEYLKDVGALFRLITCYNTWHYFKDPIGTLVAIYDKLLAVDGLLIIQDDYWRGKYQIFQAFREGGYQFCAYDNFVVFKKTAETQNLLLPLYYVPDEPCYQFFPGFPKTAAVMPEISNANKLQFFLDLFKLGLELAESTLNSLLSNR